MKINTYATHNIAKLHDILSSTDAKLLYRWEQDLGETYEIEEWHRLTQNTADSIINTSLIKEIYKILLMRYMVFAKVVQWVLGAGCLPPLFQRLWSGGYGYLVDMSESLKVLDPYL